MQKRQKELDVKRPTEKHKESLKKVLELAWLTGFTTRSNFARAHAEAVAMASQCGFIGTKDGKQFGNTWFICKAGLNLLNKYYSDEQETQAPEVLLVAISNRTVEARV